MSTGEFEVIREWSALTAAVVSGPLFLFMAVRSTRDVFTLTLCGIVGCIFQWNLAEWIGIAMGYDPDPLNPFKNFWMIWGTLLCVFFFHFALALTERVRWRRLWLGLAYLAAFLLLVPAVGGLFDDDLNLFFHGKPTQEACDAFASNSPPPDDKYESEPWNALFLISLGPCVMAALILLARGWWRSSGRTARVYGFPLIAAAILGVFGLLDVAKPWVELPPVANLAGALASIVLFRGVFKYRQVFDAILQLRESRALLQRSFERFFPPTVVRRLIDRPERVTVGGERKELTVLFSDIEGFTTLAAEMEPDEIHVMLNRYFEAMIDIVFEHEGTLDKLMGDGMMVFFGDPEEQPDHAQRAVRVALAMQERLLRLNEEWKADRRQTLTIRIGISTGPMVVGNMGSPRRLSYTVLGAAVNLAARLEKHAPSGGILVSQRTREAIGDTIPTRPVEPIHAKGFPQPVRAFVVVAPIRGVQEV